VDENVGRVLKWLDDHGETNNTIVIYTSDQGMYLGENGWFDKRWMYDVSMKTPLLARWPGHIKPGTVNNNMVQNIDYAPTFLDIAGVKPPSWMQGLSMRPLLLDPEKTFLRKYLYYHFYEYYADHTVLPHLGIRGASYKLIYFYTVNEWELYDLKKDPHELHNLAKSPAYLRVLKQMKTELIKARNIYDDHEPAGELK